MTLAPRVTGFEDEDGKKEDCSLAEHYGFTDGLEDKTATWELLFA